MKIVQLIFARRLFIYSIFFFFFGLGTSYAQFAFRSQDNDPIIDQWEFREANVGDIARVEISKSSRKYEMKVWTKAPFPEEDVFYGNSRLKKMGDDYLQADYRDFGVTVHRSLDRGSLRIGVLGKSASNGYSIDQVSSAQLIGTESPYNTGKDIFLERYAPNSYRGAEPVSSREVRIQIVNPLPIDVEIYQQSKHGRYFITKLEKGQVLKQPALFGEEYVVVDPSRGERITSTIADQLYKPLDLSRFSHLYSDVSDEPNILEGTGETVELAFTNERGSSVKIFRVEKDTKRLTYAGLVLPNKDASFYGKKGDEYVLKDLGDDKTLDHIHLGDSPYQPVIIR